MLTPDFPPRSLSGMVDTAQSQGVQIAGYPKLTPDQAADLWCAAPLLCRLSRVTLTLVPLFRTRRYEQLIVAPLKPTGSFFNEHGETLPW